MYDFSSDTQKRLITREHGTWKEYTVESKDYSIFIHMPNAIVSTIELFINKGQKEIVREWVISPDKFRALEEALNNGGIYVTKSKKVLGITKKPTVYIAGINLEQDNKISDLEKIL